MNASHAPLTDWAFTHLEMPEGATAMDVGCGGRRTINKLAEGLRDRLCRRKRRGLARAQQAADCRGPGACGAGFGIACRLRTDDKFDRVMAIETQYYWPNLRGDVKEILCVLKPGGRLMVVAENYKGARTMPCWDR
jgi:hypothetical protein